MAFLVNACQPGVPFEALFDGDGQSCASCRLSFNSVVLLSQFTIFIIMILPTAQSEKGESSLYWGVMGQYCDPFSPSAYKMTSVHILTAHFVDAVCVEVTNI